MYTVYAESEAPVVNDDQPPEHANDTEHDYDGNDHAGRYFDASHTEDLFPY
jgi:hypothetical protein